MNAKQVDFVVEAVARQAWRLESLHPWLFSQTVLPPVPPPGAGG